MQPWDEHIDQVITTLELEPDGDAAGLLRTFYSALKLPTWRSAREIAARYALIAKVAIWLEPALSALGILDLGEILTKVAACEDLPNSSLDPHLPMSQVGRYQAIADQRSAPPPQVEHLRGVLIVCALAAGRAKSPSEADAFSVDEIALTLRGLKKPGPMQGALQKISDVKSLREIADRLADALSASGLKDREFSRAWTHRIAPFLRDLTPPTSKQAPDEGKPSIKKRRPQKRDPEPPTLIGVTIEAPGLEPTDPALRSEHKIENTSHTAAAQPDFTPRWSKRRSLKKQLVEANKTIRRSNSLLADTHSEVLQDSELMGLAKNGIAACEASTADPNQNKGIALGLLVLVLGRDPEVIATMDLVSGGSRGNSPDGLALDIVSGRVWCPAIRPEHAFAPLAADLYLYEPVGDRVCMQLPPALFRAVQSAWPMVVGTKLFPAGAEKKQLATLIYAGLERLQLASFTQNITRIRRTLATRLQRDNRDLGATMLIGQDAYGRSLTTLYYYAPLISRVSSSYASVTWPWFGDDPRTLQIDDLGQQRVGAYGLVREKFAKQAFDALRGPLLKPPDTKDGNACFTYHNAMVNHTAAVICFVSTHRPTKALFELGLHDFDLISHSAVLGDKKVDAAHASRLTSTCPLASDQILALLAHLEALQALPHCGPRLKIRIRLTLDGKAPLLFLVDKEGEAYGPEIREWRDQLPVAWTRLPPNWYRTYASVHLRTYLDADDSFPAAARELVAVQLAHLEAAGFPFSTHSPLHPIEGCYRLQPLIQKLAKETGLQVHRGLGEGSSRPSASIGALNGWTQQTRIARQQMNEYIRLEKQARRAKFKTMKTAGVTAALEALRKQEAQASQNDQAAGESEDAEVPNVAEILGKALADGELEAGPPSEEARKKKPLYRKTLSEEFVLAVQAALHAEFDGNGAMQMAAHNGLTWLLRRADSRLGLDTPDPGYYLVGSTAEPSPFFPGMMLARTQILALRRKLFETDWPDDIDARAAHMALSLALCTSVSEVDEIPKLLDAPMSSIARTRVVPDAILVQIELNGVPRVHALRGVASVMYAAYLRERGTSSAPPIHVMNELVFRTLAELLDGDRAKGMLQRICQTCQINKRIEQSGLSRLSWDSLGKVHSASLERQLALLHGKAYRGSSLAGTNTAPAAPPPVRDRKIRNAFTTAETHRKYLELVNLLSLPNGEDKTFASNGEVSYAHQRETRGKELLVKAIRAFIDKPLPDIVKHFAGFALDMIEHGTQLKKDPAFSTVHSYVTAIGELATLAAKLELENLSADDFEDLYARVMEEKVTTAPMSLARAASQLLRFHDYLQSKLDVESIDASELVCFIEDSQVNVNADLVTGAEANYAIGELLQRARSADHDADLDRATSARTVEGSSIMLPLLERSRARFSEIQLISLGDVWIHDRGVVLNIRRSGYRRVKTHASRRIVDAQFRDAPNHLSQIKQWRSAIETRLGGNLDNRLPLFGELAEPRLPFKAAEVRRDLTAALEATFGARVRPHALRHGGICTDITALHLPGIKFPGSDGGVLAEVQDLSPPLLLPYDAQRVSIRYGHLGIKITVRCYYHMPWVLFSVGTASQWAGMDRATKARVSDRTIQANDKLAQRVGL